jgi:hypothetical protein
MPIEPPLPEIPFIYSEPQIESDHFAIGLIPKDGFAEVRQDYLQPILVERFPLYLLHPESIVHLVLEAPLPWILKLRPAPTGKFVAVVPRRVTSWRDAIEDVLKQAHFERVDELQWLLVVGETASPRP